MVLKKKRWRQRYRLHSSSLLSTLASMTVPQSCSAQEKQRNSNHADKNILHKLWLPCLHSSTFQMKDGWERALDCSSGQNVASGRCRHGLGRLGDVDCGGRSMQTLSGRGFKVWKMITSPWILDDRYGNDDKENVFWKDQITTNYLMQQGSSPPVLVKKTNWSGEGEPVTHYSWLNESYKWRKKLLFISLFSLLPIFFTLQ